MVRFLQRKELFVSNEHSPFGGLPFSTRRQRALKQCLWAALLRVGRMR